MTYLPSISYWSESPDPLEIIRSRTIPMIMGLIIDDLTPYLSPVIFRLDCFAFGENQGRGLRPYAPDGLDDFTLGTFLL